MSSPGPASIRSGPVSEWIGRCRCRRRCRRRRCRRRSCRCRRRRRGGRALRRPSSSSSPAPPLSVSWPKPPMRLVVAVAAVEDVVARTAVHACRCRRRPRSGPGRCRRTRMSSPPSPRIRSRPPIPLIVSGPSVPVSVWAALDPRMSFARGRPRERQRADCCQDQEGSHDVGHTTSITQKCPAVELSGMSSRRQQVLRDEPLVAVVPAPDLGRGDHEQPPRRELAARLAAAGVALEHGQRLGRVGVQALQPRAQRARRSGCRRPPSGPRPRGPPGSAASGRGGHRAAGEEALGGPGALEAVGEAAMRETCTNALPSGLQPRRDAPQQLLPVAHVLEHLDREHAVDVAVRVVAVGVGGDDLDVGDPAALGLGLDVLAVRRRGEIPVTRAFG